MLTSFSLARSSANMRLAAPTSSFTLVLLLVVSILIVGGLSLSTMVTNCVVCAPSDTSVTGVVSEIVNVWSASSV